MDIRRFRFGDEEPIRELHRVTVERSNSKDYSITHIQAWTSNEIPIERWQKSLSKNITYVAVEEKKIVGFGTLTLEGEIRQLYVHPDFQRQGIASSILINLEKEALEKGLSEVHLNSTITSHLFYLSQKYTDVEKGLHNMNGLDFEVYKMKKVLK